MQKLFYLGGALHNAYSKYTSENFTKRVSHFILFVISTIFSVNLFWNLASVLFYQFVWAAFAIALELMKVNMFMRVKYKIHSFSWRKWVEAVSIVILFVAYLTSAIISGIATLGFAMTSIEQQSFMTRNKNSRIENLVESNNLVDQNLELLDRAVESTLAEKEKMNADGAIYHTGQQKMTSDVLTLIEKRDTILEQKKEIVDDIVKEDQNYEVVAENIFNLIGSVPQINMDGKEVIFYIFLSLVILLEVMLCITSGEIHSDVNVVSLRIKKLEKYVDALFNTSGNRLNSDKTISKMTGLDVKDCMKYRKFLTNKEFGGTPLLEYGRGYSKSDFTKEEVLSIIRT